MTYDGINIRLEITEYLNNNLAIRMLDKDDDWQVATLTVNFSGSNLKDKSLAYVDTNNVQGAEVFIQKYRLGSFQNKMRTYGFCVYPLYKFDLEEVKKYQ